MRLIAAPLLAVALAAGGCGDDDESSADRPTTKTTTATEATQSQAPSSGSGQLPAENRQRPDDGQDAPLAIEDVVTAVLSTSGTVEQGCASLVSDDFVRDAYGSRQGCEAARAAEGALARAVAVEEAVESGDAAGAVATPSGGPYDGIEVEVELVADPQLEGGWLVDSLLADVPAGP